MGNNQISSGEEQKLEKYLTPLGVVAYNDSEDKIRSFFGSPVKQFTSGRAKRFIYYSDLIEINIIFFNGRVRGVLQDKVTMDMKRK